MVYWIMCNLNHPLYGALLVPFVPVQVTRCAIWLLIGILMHLLAAEPRNTAGLL